MPPATAQPRAAPQSSLNLAKRAAWMGILGSSSLGLAKLAAGWVGQSHAVIADGIESAGDAVASTVVLLGLIVSVRPPDAEHPYGHARAEDVAGKTIATMMVVTG